MDEAVLANQLEYAEKVRIAKEVLGRSPREIKDIHSRGLNPADKRVRHRVCIKCGTVFWSAHAGHRICTHCAATPTERINPTPGRLNLDFP